MAKGPLAKYWYGELARRPGPHDGRGTSSFYYSAGTVTADDVEDALRAAEDVIRPHFDDTFVVRRKVETQTSTQIDTPVVDVRPSDWASHVHIAIEVTYTNAEDEHVEVQILSFLVTEESTSSWIFEGEYWGLDAEAEQRIQRAAREAETHFTRTLEVHAHRKTAPTRIRQLLGVASVATLVVTWVLVAALLSVPPAMLAWGSAVTIIASAAAWSTFGMQQHLLQGLGGIGNLRIDDTPRAEVKLARENTRRDFKVGAVTALVSVITTAVLTLLLTS